MLIVCYTNHALDQFIRGIAERNLVDGNRIVRFGSRGDVTLDKYRVRQHSFR